MASAKTGDADYDSYFQLITQLHESLRKGDVAHAASEAIKLQSAQATLAAKNKRIPSAGRSIYDINDALGRAAFLRKDYLEASDDLLQAADTSGDPALKTLGPDLWLARALLSAGYKDVVLTFLERCKSFWPKPQLDQWIEILKSGGSPDLSHNIYSAEPAAHP